MRLRLIHRQLSGRREDTRVENAETGEMLEGVISAEFRHHVGGYGELHLRVINCEAVIETDNFSVTGENRDHVIEEGKTLGT